MSLGDATAAVQRMLDDVQLDTAFLKTRMADLSMGLSSVSASLGRILNENELQVHEKLYEWLSPLLGVFERKQKETFDTATRQDGGAEELLMSQDVQSWSRSNSATLWCTGAPGVGKTVNASYVINYLMQRHQKNDRVGVAFFYFSYKETEKQTTANLVAALVHQLLMQKPDHVPELKKLHQKHAPQRTRPSAGELFELLQTISYAFSKIYMVIDALDEYSDKNISLLLSDLQRLTKGLCLLVFSRPMPSLDLDLESVKRLHIHASEGDIKNYLLQRLKAAPAMRKHFQKDPHLSSNIVRRVLEVTRGIFLMARLYLDSLVKMTTTRKIKNALDRIPEDIGEIYSEMVQRIELQSSKDEAELALKIIAWVFFSYRPLTVEELQYALAIEHGDEEFNEDGIPHRDLMVSVCLGMIVIDGERNVVSLVHYTAQEYFQRAGQQVLEPYRLDMAKTCITCLMFKTLEQWQSIEDLTEKRLEIGSAMTEHPLLGYVAQHWGNHVRQIDDKEIMSMAVSLLRDDSRSDFVSQIKDIQDQQARGLTYISARRGVCGISLAVSFGLESIAERLITEHSADPTIPDSNGQNALHHSVANGHGTVTTMLLNSEASLVNVQDIQGWTALHHASANGNYEIAKILVEHGAQIDATDGYRGTPLYRASEAGSTSVVNYLLQLKADIHVKNQYLQTALHRAADCGHESVVKLLISYGADLDAKDHYGYNARYRAADQGHDSITKLLLEHEASYRPINLPEKSMEL